MYTILRQTRWTEDDPPDYPTWETHAFEDHKIYTTTFDHKIYRLQEGIATSGAFFFLKCLTADCTRREYFHHECPFDQRQSRLEWILGNLESCLVESML